METTQKKKLSAEMLYDIIPSGKIKTIKKVSSETN